MSQETNPPPPMQSAASQPWNEVWISAITRPSVETFEDFVRYPDATANRGYKWIFIAGLAATILGFLISLAITSISSGGSPDPYSITGLFGTSIYFLVCAAPISAVLGVVGLMISAGISQFFASALGGTGTYSKLAYAFAAYYAPLSIVTGLLTAIPILNCLAFPLGIYGIVLNVIANKAVNQFSWGKAIASSVVIIAGILVLVAVCVIVILALLGPAIGNVFSNIVTDI
jgi:pilus assembly protein Flp/PilA